MKNLLTVIAIVFCMSADAQKRVCDSLTHQCIERSPMTINDTELIETIIVWNGDKIVWSGIEEVKTCAQFKKFKKDYPLFYLPKQIIAHFKCK